MQKWLFLLLLVSVPTSLLVSAPLPKDRRPDVVYDITWVYEPKDNRIWWYPHNKKARQHIQTLCPCCRLNPDDERYLMSTEYHWQHVEGARNAGFIVEEAK